MHSEEVLDFLRNNPDFIREKAEYFGWLHPKDQIIIPFAEQQIRQLQSQNAGIKQQLAQWQQQARENEVLLGRIHQLTLSLLPRHSSSACIQAALECFEQQFGLNRVLIRLWGSKQWPPECLASPALQQQAHKLQAPSCGHYASEELVACFSPEPVLQSFARLALRSPDGKAFGLLVIASDDADRFSPELDTHYLSQIGAILSHALWHSMSTC
ncbi:DUF484 family protein [Craterilacuibacter sp. RT1T]|uniref:DUF484 family protein n=1 Tax=Craterilacuibacter sp. RT1T TaxID=2942211 RepID=UPI0020BE1837|nr:DUF484 family protein [Craterilacuibacter sp. RT1T]MCL6263150.1 DUF484 family protein [Craterilacuibacter sp. RT1T]